MHAIHKLKFRKCLFESDKCKVSSLLIVRNLSFEIMSISGSWKILSDS